MEETKQIPQEENLALTELTLDSKPHAATTVPIGRSIDITGRIYNRDVHENAPPPQEWFKVLASDGSKSPPQRGVTFKSIEETHVAAWLTNAQLRKDQGIVNILLTRRISERTYGQRVLWGAILAREDIRSSRNKGADTGHNDRHDNGHDTRLRNKWLDYSAHFAPLFVQLATDHREVVDELYKKEHDGNLIRLVYKNNLLTITLYDEREVPLKTFENLFIHSMKP